MLFNNLKVKSINFVIVAGQVIWTEEIKTVSIPLASNDNIKLHNIVLVPGYNLNLISFGQLYKTRIIYYNNPSTMTLIQ